MKPKIKIDIVSDVVCPWCYIGKRRLEKAISELSDQYEFALEYHPYELNPEMPEHGVNQKEYLSKKFGNESTYYQRTNHTTQIAALEGLEFNFNKQRTSPNTRKAHCIIQGAKEEGKHLDVMEAFFKAYFTDGMDLSEKENLIAVAVSAGMQREKIEKLMADDALLAEVAFAELEMQKSGIGGVPFYIVNNRYSISGAQSSETFKKALAEIGDQTLLHEGTSCNADSPC